MPCLPFALGVLLAAGPAWPRETRAAGVAGTPRAAGASADSARAALRGAVIDAATAEPLPGVTVVLTPQPEGAVAPGAGAGAGAYLAGARRARTDGAGRYRFDGLAAGAYRLYAARVGYAAAAVDVTIADAAPEVSLGLTVAPLALRPVEVRARGAVAGPGADRKSVV